ncbi:MAG TPA: cyclic nucleotide-binding domain-containing protein, partial [Longimicrobiales bacterium]|nr:cyclic nucleotide-binding domain-containing protein [Longimicrobiales bacterium]
MAAAEPQGWTVEQVVPLLEKVPLFQGLQREDLERIAGLVRGRSVRENELLFREGDPGDKFYIVFKGAIEILKERPRGEHDRLAIKRAGEPFGEMSLLTDASRSASARAVEPTDLLAVAKADFDRLLGGETLTVRMMRQLAKALQSLDVRFAAKEAGGGSGADALRQFSRLV